MEDWIGSVGGMSKRERVLPSETIAGTSFTAVIKEKWRPQQRPQKKGCRDPGHVQPWTLCLEGEILLSGTFN